MKTDNAPEPVGMYPHSRRVGNLLFLSGVGPRKPGTKVIPGVMMDGQGNAVGHDIETQCHSVFENVRIILEASGSSWGKLVDVTVFLTDMQRVLILTIGSMPSTSRKTSPAERRLK